MHWRLLYFSPTRKWVDTGERMGKTANCMHAVHISGDARAFAHLSAEDVLCFAGKSVKEILQPVVFLQLQTEGRATYLNDQLNSLQRQQKTASVELCFKETVTVVMTPLPSHSANPLKPDLSRVLWFFGVFLVTACQKVSLLGLQVWTEVWPPHSQWHSLMVCTFEKDDTPSKSPQSLAHASKGQKPRKMTHAPVSDVVTASPMTLLVDKRSSVCCHS